ncbi:MAG TPA: ATP-binding protein [Candidatus Binatia bacterium]|nr:ATP-binding protein [Candidatus Binatia bacterium]
MNWRPTTLRSRLTLWYTGILTAMLALLGATSVILLDRSLRKNVDDSLSSVARAIAESVRRPFFFGSDLEDSLHSLLGPELAERFFQLLDPFGRLDPRLVPRSRSRLPLSVEAFRNAERGEATLETVALRPGSEKSFRLLTLPVRRNGATVNIVQVAMSLENVDAARSRFLLVLLVLAPLALAAAALGGWFLARRALTPVDAIVEAARRIEAEDLTKRVPALSSDDELGRLTAVLNDMLARLEGSFGAVRRFSADAAHELRTPLTILKGEIEVALRSSQAPPEIRETLASCLEEVDRLNSLVEDLLLMARMEGNALSTPPRLVNLAEVVENAAPALSELAARAANTFIVGAAPPLWIEGYDSLLFRLVFNLGENAIKYTPAGGRIETTLERQNGSAVLEVKDTGSGIPAEVQAHIFDRFYRGDPSREGGGTGLGLALVRSIVQLHHGEIRVFSTPGEGSCFRVTLPLAPPPSS